MSIIKGIVALVVVMVFVPVMIVGGFLWPLVSKKPFPLWSEP